MSNHRKFLDHVTLISWIFLKFLEVVGIIEIFLFNWDSLHAKAEQPLQDTELQEKESKKY